MRSVFWSVILICGMASGCGYLKKEFKGDSGSDGEKGEKGEKGDPGENGKDGEDGSDGRSGERGPSGLPGSSGRDGQDGAMGERGPRGYPGNIERLVRRHYYCTAQYQLNKSQRYELKLNVYDLTTEERFLDGRSDFFESGSSWRPDSSSGYGDNLETSSFRFRWLNGKWNWLHIRSGRNDWFTCRDITAK